MGGGRGGGDLDGILGKEDEVPLAGVVVLEGKAIGKDFPWSGWTVKALRLRMPDRRAITRLIS